MNVLFHLDLDCFFASVETALHPELGGKPVCVGGLRGQRGIVACPNYEARAYGVRTAMPLRTAEKLLPREAVFLRGNHRLYGEYSRRVMTVLESFTPDVWPKSIDEALLDVGKCLHLWRHDPETMASAIKNRVRAETGLTISVGIAPNPLCAKIAAGIRKPDGLVLVRHDMIRDFLTPLPVDVVPGIGPKTIPRLNMHGIRTIGDLLNRKQHMPESYLSGLLQSLLSEEPYDGGGHHHDEEEQSISRDRTFSRDTQDDGQIAATLFALVERCCKTLRAGGRAASTVTVKVRFANFITVQKQLTLPCAAANEEDIFPAARRLLKELLPAWRFVRLVGVKVSNLVPLEGQQLMLDTVRTERLEPLHRRIDALQERYGYRSVRWGIAAGEEREPQREE